MFFLLEVEIQTAVETETHVATRDKIKMSDCLWKKKKKIHSIFQTAVNTNPRSLFVRRIEGVNSEQNS